MMDVFQEAARYLITSVALITSTGRHSANVMSAEWTFQVSYRPMRLIVLVNPRDATHENILESREFGANFLSDDQAALANLAGYYTGREVNKLSSGIFQTYPAKNIHAPMILDCLLNAECRVVQVLETGDHTMFLGDVVNVEFDQNKSPLLYSQRRYWQRGPLVERKPLIYVICTVNPDRVRLDGRLQGVKDHPQEVSLTVSPLNGEPVLKETVQTDVHGYFDLVRSNTILSKGAYIAKAEWNDLTGTASVSVS